MDETHEKAIPWLLILLRNPLTLAWLDGDIGPGFTLQNELFEAIADTDLSGFYDRLYGADGAFVGVQITPVPQTEITSAVDGLPYARTVNGNDHLRLFLVGPPSVEPREVADQAFGGRVYRSFAGELAFSFDTFFLDDAERNMLTKASAAWVDVAPLGS